MNGWVAVLMVWGCAATAPLLGWLFVRVFLSKSWRQPTEKREPDNLV